MNTNTVAVATIYPATRVDVWSALVNPDRLRRWLGDVTITSDDTQPSHIAIAGTGEHVLVRVVSCVSECRLILDWSVDGETSTIIATLGDADTGTAVILQEDGVPTAMLDAYRRGWTAHLRRLEAELSGDPMPTWADLAQV